MKVLVGCEYSGIVRDAFIRAGHDAISCDIVPSESDFGPHHQGDLLEYIETHGHEFDLLIAHPPCTHLSVSGARWFPPYTKEGEVGYKPLHLRFEALAFVDKILNCNIPMICLENPLSVISGYIRKSDQTMQPWQFGHLESKRTCLWLKGLPPLNHTDNVHDEMMLLDVKVRNRIWWMGSGKGKERSKFYTGFAEAMATQWGSINDEPCTECGQPMSSNKFDDEYHDECYEHKIYKEAAQEDAFIQELKEEKI